MNPVRIGIDVRYLSHGLTGGVRSYVFHLCSRLPALAPRWEFVFYADRKAPFELAGALPANVTLRLLPWHSPLTSIVNDRRIGRWMAADRVALAHFPANQGQPGPYQLIVTVHDSLNLFPFREHLRGFGKTPRKAGMMAYLGWQTSRALARADHILTVSEDARADIARRSGTPVEKITAVHEAADPVFRVLEWSEWLDALGRRHEFHGVVVLGDGIKNPGAAVAAWNALTEHARDAAMLVFFSREPAPRAELASHLPDPRIRFIPQPSTEDLVGLMNLASVFVFPSFYEGFGIPLVEAMRCGLAVVASSRGSIPEVVGEGGLIFDLDRPNEFAAALGRVLASPELRNGLREAALRRATAFSWEETARKTLALYERTLGSRAR